METTSNQPAELLSMAEVEEVSRKNYENKQAQLRGDPPPHNLPQELLVRALQSIRGMRATGTQRPASKKAAASGAPTKEMNIDKL